MAVYFNTFAAQFLYLSRVVLFVLIGLFFFAEVAGQSLADTTLLPLSDTSITKDTASEKDTIQTSVIPFNDSVSKRPVIDSTWFKSPVDSLLSGSFIWQVMGRNPYFDFRSKPVALPGSTLKTFNGKELLFYLLVLLLIVFALFRQLFPKYFSDLFRVFFRTTLKQRQIREQLMQTPLPSLLLNGFFVISGGLYISFLLQYFNLGSEGEFWILFLYSCLGLSIAYMVKFLGLKIAGWIFSIKETTDSYIFIVFIINKMIGILLLPFLVLLAFGQGKIYSFSLTLSWCLIAAMLMYRIILSFSVVRNQIKVNPFHFFLYFCAFEIAPLLLVYRGLLLFFGITA